ncbi:hypothetical protein, partial [Burkholderia cenocepacia]|uniref:hypothetical protein n=1 Tax=Burkholderia cenocepacia TaxID=95486 RepID=UPI002AB0C556
VAQSARRRTDRPAMPGLADARCAADRMSRIRIRIAEPRVSFARRVVAARSVASASRDLPS